MLSSFKKKLNRKNNAHSLSVVVLHLLLYLLPLSVPSAFIQVVNNDASSFHPHNEIFFLRIGVRRKKVDLFFFH